MHNRLIDQSQVPGQEQQILYTPMTVYLGRDYDVMRSQVEHGHTCTAEHNVQTN